MTRFFGGIFISLSFAEKTKGMNYVRSITIMLMLISSCSLFEVDLPNNRSRGENYRSGGESNTESPGSGAVTPAPKPDTSYFVSAVRYPDGYDWQKDPAYGGNPSDVLFYKNDELLLTIPAGNGRNASPAADTHHIIDGHLYTEYSSSSETIIRRDGAELLKFSGREFLKGMLFVGDDIYTLSQYRSGNGFTFRVNGDIILEKKYGSVYGGLGEPSYGKNGALYEQDGHICFAYMVRTGSSSRSYMVVDGNESAVSRLGSGEMMDVRLIGGEAVSISQKQFGYSWKNARIWEEGDSYAVTGDYSSDDGKSYLAGIYHASDKKIEHFGGEGSMIWFREGAAPVVYDSMEIEENDFLYHSFHLDIMGNEFVEALNPIDGKRPPFIAKGGDTILEYEGLNGYLTGVEVIITPPKSRF